MIVVVDEGFDLSVKISSQEVVFQQDRIPQWQDYTRSAKRYVLRAAARKARKGNGSNICPASPKL